jgi:hypothetical protein
MPDKFRVVARRSYLDSGMPKVGREVIGLYLTRAEAEVALYRVSQVPCGQLQNRVR